MSDADYDLVGAVLEIARSGSTRLGALADVQHAGAVFILGEDVTNTAPMLDLTVRTWLRLRPTAEEERVDISRWNDAAIGRAKRREPSPLWIAAPHATKLDEVAGETWHAAPADIARLALAVVHELDPSAGAACHVSPATSSSLVACGAAIHSWLGSPRLARPLAASFQRLMSTRSSSAVGRNRSQVRTVRSSIGAVLVTSSPRMKTASACWTSARAPRARNRLAAGVA